MRIWIAVALSLLAATPAIAKCKFAYTEEVRADVVRPALERLRALDWDNPPSVKKGNGGKVELVFHNRRPDLMDCPFIMLVLEDCGQTVVGAYSAFPTPGSPWQAMQLPPARAPAAK